MGTIKHINLQNSFLNQSKLSIKSDATRKQQKSIQGGRLVIISRFRVYLNYRV